MNINILGFGYSPNNENTVASNNGKLSVALPEGATQSDAGLALLKQMSKGDVFTGEIINITQNEITLSLSDNVSIKASLSDALSYNIGDMATFSIKENDGDKIFLKSVNQENVKNLMNDQTITQAIRNAGLSVNDTTVSLVHNLMKNGQPIDSKTLNSYVRILDNVTNATPEDVVLMTKMDIPVTKENVAALHDYYDFSEGISGKANDMSKELGNFLSELANQSPEVAARFIKEYVNTFSPTISQTSPINTVFSEDNLNELNQMIDNLIDEPEYEKNIETDSEIEKPKTLANELSEKISNGKINAKEFFNELNELTSDTKFNKEEFKKLVNSNQFKELINTFTREEMFMKPEDVSKESLKHLYAKVITDNQEIASKFGGIERLSSVINSQTAVNNDINFLNDASHLMNFVQIPIQMSGQNAHGDLYVYKNKKSGEDSDGELKAMLHLDMDNLGPLDIFVTLLNKNVSTNFKVEDEKILDFIEAHMNELTMALNKLGYNVTASATVNDGNYSFKKDVVEEILQPTEIKRFSFDVRA